ncbi:hypothetical protein [Clostridium botulinum]|uniref:hypothetical protein n=1 Tax=Clostridium botulinum TaxID=1491 RepID=UPI00016DBA11|nr:hypothetical protein [Clostridium botulinum]EKX78800.1 hypothetical protein CFSAN001628_017244 [Clostridium botulinum CFSAN001628]ACA57248.1 hypothetical protein CLK_A0233 [Clostridium botulinum A3 str. Loch Maree]MBD5563685.1 hypothetical protein [Clostridium botulinum]MBD5568413.1 hypothetical protein [Clostridium botulinum]MBD5572123.1 hypothetical protein [Clostridium botulinum]
MSIPNNTKHDMQEINHQVNILIDLANEKPTNKLLKSFKSIAKKIKIITDKYAN